jgi:hypothetical protein
MENEKTYCAFVATRRVAAGSLEATLAGLMQHLASGGAEALVFEDQSGRQLELDLTGSLEEVLARAREELAPDAAGPARSGPGRPKLGVVSREVSLLPRHWAWLELQPGGASAGLRRLVEVAQKSPMERAKRARDAASKFMWAMTGNLPNFEEATRALFAGDQPRLEALIADWPEDLRQHVEQLTRGAAQLARQAG